MDAKPLLLALFLAPAALAADPYGHRELSQRIEAQQLHLEQMNRDQEQADQHAEVMRRLDQIERQQRPQPVPAAAAGGYYPELMRNQCLAFPQTPGCQ